MKKIAIPLLGITTAILLLSLILIMFHASMTAIFVCQGCGIILLPYAVYRVLREPYVTTKKFDDWYQDEPRQNN